MLWDEIHCCCVNEFENLKIHSKEADRSYEQNLNVHYSIATTLQIEKYGKTKNSPSTVPNFESQFMSAKSVFERRLSEAAAAATAATAESSTAKSASATTSPVKRLDTCRKFAATLVDQQR